MPRFVACVGTKGIRQSMHIFCAKCTDMERHQNLYRIMCINAYNKGYENARYVPRLIELFCLLLTTCCLLLTTCCLLLAACCMLHAACCLLLAIVLLAICRLLLAICRLQRLPTWSIAPEDNHAEPEPQTVTLQRAKRQRSLSLLQIFECSRVASTWNYMG